MAHFYLKEVPDSVSVKLSFLEADGSLIAAYASDAKERGKKLELKKGMNRFVWDMRYPDAETFEGMILWAGRTDGPKAVPGTYTLRLNVGEDVQEQPFTILADPRSSASLADMQAQFDFLIDVRDKLSEAHQAIADIRKARQQIRQVTERLPDEPAMEAVQEKAKAINEQMTQVEEALYQTKNESRQDPLNFPIRLNNKLAHLGMVSGYGDARPTEQAMAFKKEVTAAIDAELEKWYQVRDREVPAFNELVREKQLDAVVLSRANEAPQR